MKWRPKDPIFQGLQYRLWQRLQHQAFHQHQGLPDHTTAASSSCLHQTFASLGWALGLGSKWLTFSFWAFEVFGRGNWGIWRCKWSWVQFGWWPCLWVSLLPWNEGGSDGFKYTFGKWFHIMLDSFLLIKIDERIQMGVPTS